VTNTAKAYYGDKLSENILETPEGFLICKNVKIARIGWMDYHGSDLPEVFAELPGTPIRVKRTPEEVFRPETLASFEGKPVTNTHPSNLLDVNTTPMIERGHVQNVRRDGDFIVADLFIKEAGLISEIQNNLKREVSCGYECSWHKIGDGEYEQRDIIGNHVAVVRNGRAGPKVAIKDSKPNKEDKKKHMKISQKILAAIGFKHFAQDADPEDIAKAMDALSEEKPDKEAEPVKDEAEEKPHSEKSEEKFFKEILSRIEALEGKSGDKKGAKDELSELEKEMTNDTKDDDDDKEEMKKEADDEAEEEEKEESKKSAADSVLLKFVKDMRPVIMGIKDEKLRNEVAQKFTKSVRDARGEMPSNKSYVDILKVATDNKKKALDDANNKANMSNNAQIAAAKWKEYGNQMNGGNK